jgi:N-methylhydantoinase A
MNAPRPNPAEAPKSARAASLAKFRFGFDIGGTFTDFVLSGSDGTVFVSKSLTNAQDIARTIFDGLQGLLQHHAIGADQIDSIVAGATTFVTNLIIERKGARTALITTAGFRDIIEIAREIRYDVYDLTASYPDPIIPRALRLELKERIDSSGAILVPLDERCVEEAIVQLVNEGVEALAVCFLHAFKNPEHEARVRAIANRLAPDLPVSLSSEVLPELREYERTVAAAVNAYAMPQARKYLHRIEKLLGDAGVQSTLQIMQSNGGIISREIAERVPIRMLESGPAAGALAAAHVARFIGLTEVLAFDMGGTTAKACLISSGDPEVTTEFETARVHRFKRGSGLPIRLPIVDLIEIGAGGGSIARIDATGLLKVGPTSAGAEPGPACYGRGGEAATVTDAAVVLGYLNPNGRLGGEVKIDAERAREAIRSNVADPIGLDVVEAAAGIHRIVCEHMAAAAKVHAVEKGCDVRHYALFAFGGAGPIFARSVARYAGCSRVIVPPHAGVFSALGLLAAPIKFDAVQSRYSRLAETCWADIEEMYREMERALGQNLEASGAEGGAIVRHRSADMRYVGQGFEITVPVPSSLTDVAEQQVIAAFNDLYQKKFGNYIPGGQIEILNWRADAAAPIPWPDVLRLSYPSGPTHARSTRPVYFAELGKFQETPVYRDPEVAVSETRQGPLLIEQAGSTIVIGPSDRFEVDKLGNVLISLATRQ